MAASGQSTEVIVVRWEFPGHWGQLPLPLPEVAENDTDVLRTVLPGESRTIVAAFEQAARMAEQLWDALEKAGLGTEAIAVVPSLTDDLRPVVRVQLTPAGAYHAGWLLGGGAGPPNDQASGGLPAA